MLEEESVSYRISDIAQQAAAAAIRGCPAQIEQLFEEACARVGEKYTRKKFAQAFALEAARALDAGDYIKFEKLFDGIRNSTEIPLGQICRTFSAEGADPALVPCNPQPRSYSTLAVINS